MRRLPLILALTSALGAAGALPVPARAVETPKAGAADPRIKTVDYDPMQVVRVVGVFRTATQIILSEEETIQHVALGDTSGWDVAAEKNILFAKPKAARAPTNLIVTTTTGTETRNYTFELATRSGSTAKGARDTFFVVRFRYPQQQRSQLVQALSAEAAELELKVVQLKLDRGVIEGPRNLAYALQGSTSIAPSEVSDNGRFTVLRFPGAQAIPAVYVVTPDGAESLVPFDVRGEFVLIHQTAPLLRLRRGREVLCIHNQAYAPYGVNLGTGTSAADVDRTLKDGAKP